MPAISAPRTSARRRQHTPASRRAGERAGQAVAWVAIFYAATISIVGLFATSTIAGAPAGVVLGALGIGLGASGSFVLWVVDKIKWNSKRICW